MITSIVCILDVHPDYRVYIGCTSRTTCWPSAAAATRCGSHSATLCHPLPPSASFILASCIILSFTCTSPRTNPISKKLVAIPRPIWVHPRTMQHLSLNPPHDCAGAQFNLRCRVGPIEENRNSTTWPGLGSASGKCVFQRLHIYYVLSVCDTSIGCVTNRSPVEDYGWFRVIVLHGTPMLGVPLASRRSTCSK
jgi:hypothetical protein